MLTGTAGRGQNDVGATPSGIAAAAVGQRVAGGHRDSLGGRAAVGGHAADHPAAVRGATPQLQRRGARRRGFGDGPPGRRQPGASRRAVPRRMRRDQRQRAGSVANTVGGRGNSPGPPRRGGLLPGPIPAGAGRQPVPVRAGRSTGLHLRGRGQTALPGQAVRAPDGPGGPAGGDASGARRGIHGRRRRVDGAGSPAGGGGARRGRRALATARIPHQCRSQRDAVAAKVSPWQRRDGTAAAQRWTVGCSASAAWIAHCGSRGAWPTWPAGSRPGSTKSPPR